MSELALLGPPLMTVECEEKGETIQREVRPGRLTTDRLRFIWEKTKDFDTIFNDFTRGDPISFINHFILNVNGEVKSAGLIWDVDDVGILFLNELKPGISATAHFLFWDRKFRGRKNLCREMLKYVFHSYGFRRIEARVPLYAKYTIQATEQVGFVKEGRMRKAIKWRDDWFDMYIYSILPEDLNHGT